MRVSLIGVSGGALSVLEEFRVCRAYAAASLGARV